MSMLIFQQKSVELFIFSLRIRISYFIILFINSQCDNWDSGNSVTFYGMYDNILFRSGGTASDPYEGSFTCKTIEIIE